MDLSIPIGKDFVMSGSITSLIIIAIGLIIFAIIIRNKLKKADPNKAPTGILNIMEMYVELVDGFVESTMGKHNMKYAPFIFTLFTLLIVSNLSGLIGLVPPTSNYSVTLTLALVVFIMVQVVGIKTSGLGGYIKGFTEPIPLLTPLNIIGELANPVSLSFRLFGNILSGMLIMTLVNSFIGVFRPLFAPFLHIYFDLFSGVLQAFIFTMLTMVFISGNTEE